MVAVAVPTLAPPLLRALARTAGAVHAWGVLGQGSEHVAWQVETASGPWVLRVRWGAAVDERAERIRLTREAAVMARVRRLALPVAEAIVLEGEPDRDPRADDEHHPDRDHDRDHDRGGANGAGGGGGVALAYRRLPGRPLQDLLAEGAVLPSAATELAARVGRMMAALATLVVDGSTERLPVDEDGPEVWLAGVEGFLRIVGTVIGPTRRRAVERFVATAAPPGLAGANRRFAHNDLGAEHILVDDRLEIVGVIDWSDAALADPAADLGRLLRDLGAVCLGAAVDGYGVAGIDRLSLLEHATWYARCLAVENLAFAITDRPDLLALEQANVARLFPV